MNSPILGWPLVLSAGIAISGFASNDRAVGQWAVASFAAFLMVAGLRSVRLCSGVLRVRRGRVFARDASVGHIRSMVVGKVRLGGGSGGSYYGFALAVEITELDPRWGGSGQRARQIIVWSSLYNGTQRLAEWADAISQHPGFGGSVRVVDEEIELHSRAVL